MYVLLLMFSAVVLCITGNITDNYPFATTPTVGQPPTAVPGSTPEVTEQLPQLTTTGQKETEHPPATSGGNTTEHPPATSGGNTTEHPPATSGGNTTEHPPATSGGNTTKPRTLQHNTTKSHTKKHNNATEPFPTDPHNTTEPEAVTLEKVTTEIHSTDTAPATCVGRCGSSTSQPEHTQPGNTQPEITTPQPEITTPQPRVTGTAVNTDSRSGTQTNYTVTDPGSSTTSAPVPIWYSGSTASSSQSRDSSRSGDETRGTTVFTYSTTTIRNVRTEVDDDDTEGDGDGGGTGEPRTAIPNDKNKGLILALSQVFAALLLLLIFALLALLLFKLNNKTPEPVQVEGEVIELEAGVFRGGEINSEGVKTETERDRDSERERDSESGKDSNNTEIEVSNKRTAVYSDTLIISNVIRTNEPQSDSDKTSSL